MKTIITIVACVLLGIVLFGFIAGDTNSLKSAATDLFNGGKTQLSTIVP